MQNDQRHKRRRTKSSEEPVRGQRLAGRKGVFAFLAIFGVLIAGFYIFIGFISIYNCGILPAYHCLIAAASAKILSFLGEQATVSGAYIFSSRNSVQIVPGCDAIEATALFVCAILAFPAGLLQKVVGIICGTISLMVLNFARIVVLFLLGIYTPGIVEFMHIEVMQGLFILFAVVLWVGWLLWIARNSMQIKTVSPSASAR